jgi:hypothetical protein
MMSKALAGEGCMSLGKGTYTDSKEERNTKTLNVFDQDFTNICYLSGGNERQKAAYTLMDELQIIEILNPFNPILVGTIPINIDIPESDLDIICEVNDNDFSKFEELVWRSFYPLDQFRYSIRTVNGMNNYVANFIYKSWEFEIFGQPLPTHLQNGYKHVMIEYRILHLLGTDGNEQIRALKRKGLKTEPAFAQLLNLEGDPYDRLLELFEYSDEALKGLLYR